MPDSPPKIQDVSVSMNTNFSSYFFAVLLFIILSPMTVFAAPSNTIGRIILDVQQNGEAYYVYPVDERAYYLGRPDDAFEIMRTLGLGISNTDFAQFENDFALRQRLSGRILLQVEAHGEAYYVNPIDLRAHYLGRPADAFQIMSDLGLGISSSDLATISRGTTNIPDVYYDVPFTTQAPFGEWDDLRQQEGCEEASVMMAMKWIHGEEITAEEARSEILQMSNWEQEEFGYFEDTSAQDTATRLFNRWYGYTKVDVYQNISATDILAQLEEGNIVLPTIDGTFMNHNYYVPPGPDRHMIVVHGYDYATGEFITHDPGTRFGEDHRIPFSTMNEMLRDYPSGQLLPVTTSNTAMIVVRK